MKKDGKKDWHIWTNVKVYETLARTDFSSAEYAVALAILRITTGYKEYTKRGNAGFIKGKWIAELTGFGRSYIAKILKRLEEYHMIKIERFTKGNQKTTNLITLIDLNSWRLPKREFNKIDTEN